MREGSHHTQQANQYLNVKTFRHIASECAPKRRCFSGDCFSGDCKLINLCYTMEDLPFKAEYAKSGRAGCKGCKGNIGKDTLRLARMVQVSCKFFC